MHTLLSEFRGLDFLRDRLQIVISPFYDSKFLESLGATDVGEAI
jgi:hypothetical protein